MSVCFTLYVAFSLAASVVLLSSPYLRVTSLGWFIGIWSLPYIGSLCFFLTVVRHRKTGYTLHYNELDRYATPIDVASDPIAKDIQRMNDLGRQYGFLSYFSMESDKAKILVDGQFIESLYESIDSAQKRIWITTYIFSGDVKKTIIEKLTAAHNRGVDIKLLVDRIGSGLVNPFSSDKRAFDDLPFATETFHQQLQHSLFFIEKRLHSKIVIADDTAFIGAHNLRDEVLSEHKAFVNNISLYFTGTVVKQLEAVFADLWEVNCGEQIMASDDMDTEAAVGKTTVDAQDKGHAFARISFSEPMIGSYQYNGYFTSLFFAARKRILIWMPYIIPTQSMRSALIAASKLGLEVKVLMPAKTDSFLVDNSHELVLRELTDNGVECALSSGTFDHSKIIIIDDMAIIGSTNLDYRSLFRNYECNIEVCDPTFCGSVASLFEAKYQDAQVIKEVNASKIKNISNQLTSMIGGLY